MADAHKHAVGVSNYETGAERPSQRGRDVYAQVTVKAYVLEENILR